ncbi:MAG: dihydrofolate reductase [Cyclobacteriaceae bacterium]|jgi:dihydrofolate reductase
MSNRSVVLYISMSLDGYIATKDHDLSWLAKVDREGEDYGYFAFTENVDTYIVGSKTYEVVLQMTGGAFPKSEQYDCYVVTRQQREPVPGITFYHGDLAELIQSLKKQKGKQIYCDGGAQIVKMLMADNLIDEYIVSVIPTILGDGIRLFPEGLNPIDIELVSSKPFESGLVQLHYKRN